MMQRPKKMSEDLFRTLRETIQSKGPELFLIGGLAMAYHGLKLATKDVDIVFLKESEARSFMEDMEIMDSVRTQRWIGSVTRRMRERSLNSRD